MKYLKRNKEAVILFLLLMVVYLAKAGDTTAVVANTMAQKSSEAEMADAMRSNGKIYVVVAVLTLIFIGIVVYQISLNRKLNKLERLIKER
jgi:CcmD family protein